jgi:hypothetical protein
VLGKLDLRLSDEVLTKLELNMKPAKPRPLRRSISRPEQRIKQLKSYLGSPDREKEETTGA